MKSLIIITQIIGGITILVWPKIFTLTLLHIKFHPKKKITNWLVIIITFFYPFFIGLSYWFVHNNISKKNGNIAIFWSIVPIIVFTILYFLSNYRARYLKKR